MNVVCPLNREIINFDFCLFMVLLIEGFVTMNDLFPFVCITIIPSLSRIRCPLKNASRVQE